MKDSVFTGDLSIIHVYGKYIYYVLSRGYSGDTCLYAMNMNTGKSKLISNYYKSLYYPVGEYAYNVYSPNTVNAVTYASRYMPVKSNRYMALTCTSSTEPYGMCVVDCKTAKKVKVGITFAGKYAHYCSQLSNGKWAILDEGDSYNGKPVKLYIVSADGKAKRLLKTFDETFRGYQMGAVYKNYLFYKQYNENYEWQYYRYDIVNNKTAKISVKKWVNALGGYGDYSSY